MELANGLLDLVPKHPFGVLFLLVVCLAIVIDRALNDVLADHSTLLCPAVQEGKVLVSVEPEIVNGSRDLIFKLKALEGHDGF